MLRLGRLGAGGDGVERGGGSPGGVGGGVRVGVGDVRGEVGALSTPTSPLSWCRQAVARITNATISSRSLILPPICFSIVRTPIVAGRIGVSCVPSRTWQCPNPVCIVRANLLRMEMQMRSGRSSRVT